MRSLLKIFRNEPVILIESRLKRGLVVKMNPTQHSHVKSPYYVEIVYASPSRVITSIPEEHELVIQKDGIDDYQWNYQLGRMEIIGPREKYGHLLYNQFNGKIEQ